MNTSVIIPNWNGRHLLKNCLSSLRRQTLINFEVIVVDNGSVDGSVEYIKRYFPEVKVVKLDKNYGFAKAVNIGIRQSRGENIVLINNDTEVDKDCLQYLYQAAQSHPQLGFIAAKILNFYHRHIIDSAGDYIDAVGHADNIGRGQIDGLEFSKPRPVFLATGGGALFKRWVFEKVGYFDEDFFAYFEDVDLCFRAQLQGIKGWFEPKAKIYHIHKATADKIKPLTEYLQFRNMTQTVIKNFPTGLLLKDFNWLKMVLVNLNTIRYLALQGYLFEAVRAEIYILFHLPKLLWKRWQIQSSKKVPDKYIIDNIKPKKITFYGLLSR